MSKEEAILSAIKVGRQRNLVFYNIGDKPMLVSEIQKSTNDYIKNSKAGKEIRLSDVSRALKNLVEFGAVKCLNPRRRIGDKGILYVITKKGKNIKKLLI